MTACLIASLLVLVAAIGIACGTDNLFAALSITVILLAISSITLLAFRPFSRDGVRL